ncbi:MAG: hypothetical protein DWI02_04745 [Planctomycetota bacterium]|nr:MAG: hypothetical protein DWI02_04745 [Planctomycetota bacterium]
MRVILIDLSPRRPGWKGFRESVVGVSGHQRSVNRQRRSVNKQHRKTWKKSPDELARERGRTGGVELQSAIVLEM